MNTKLKFCILCEGTYGDILPYVALGLKLREKGHAVRIATNKGGKALCQKYDLEFVSIDRTPTLAAVIKRFLKPSYPISTLLRILLPGVRFFKEYIRHHLEGATEAVANSDVLIYNPHAYAGPHLAEYYQIPSFCMLLQPELKTKKYSSYKAPLPKFLGNFGNWLGHLLSQQMLWQIIRPQVNQWRKKQLHLRKMHFLGPYYDRASRNTPHLIACSPYLIPAAHDWKSSVHVTSFSRIPKNEAWTPSRELQSFLNNGPPPIYVSFGSVLERYPQEFIELLIKVLKKKKIRTLLQGPLPQISCMSIPDYMLIIDYTPHDWLFPHVKALLYHGGIGTTAEGLYAGKPLLAMPSILDQFFWAKKLPEWGVGPLPLSIKTFDEKLIESGLNQLLTTPSYQEKASQIKAHLIKEEEGTEVAYRVIHETLIPL